MKEAQTIPSLNASLAIALEREKALLDQLEGCEEARKRYKESALDAFAKLDNLTNFMTNAIKMGYLKIPE